MDEFKIDLIIKYITSMSNSYAFAFPKPISSSFKLLGGTTVGYLADSIFYRLDLTSGKAEALHHPEGRSFQAFASLPKRGITVLADYGKSSNLTFYFLDQTRNFQIKNICPLEVISLQFSLDGKYLAVACGSPSMRVIMVNVDDKKIIGGSRNFIDLKGNTDKLIKMQFNPANRKIISLVFKDKVQIYEFKDCLQMTEKGVENGVIVLLKQTLIVNNLQASVWDELGNIYLSGNHRLWVWSTETGKEIVSYDIEQETDQDTVRALVLTPKHIITFYVNGHTEWLIKYYPELLDQDSLTKPFQLDQYHDSTRKVVHALYSQNYDKLLLAYQDGFMGILAIPAQSNQTEDEDQPQGKKEVKQAKKMEIESSLIGPYHRSSIILITELEATSLVITVSKGGRVILWSGKQRRQLGFFDADGPVTTAAINNKYNVLALGRSDGIVMFYSISSFQTPYLFKQFRLTKGKSIDQIEFSSSSEELAVLSKSQDRIYFVLTALNMPFEVLGYVSLPHKPISFTWNSTPKTAIKPKHEHLLICIGYGVLLVNGPAAVPAKRRGEQLNIQADIYALRTDLDQNLVSVLPSGQVLTTGEDKLIKKYRQPEQPLTKVDFKSKIPIPPPLEEIDAHDLKIVCWRCTGKWLVSGAADGTVQIRDTTNLSQVKTYKVVGWRQQNLGWVSASKAGGIYAGSHDGCFQVWRGGDQVLADQHKMDQAAFKKLPNDRDTKYFEIMIEQQYLERMKDVISGKKKVQLQKLAKIKHELKELLIENDKHEELQRLNRDQFAIDLDSRQKTAQIGKEKCLKIREDSRLKILKNEVLAKKLKQITWDRMDVQLKAVNGLKNNFIVYNYHIRKVSNLDKRRLELIFDLRRNQRKEAKKQGSDLNYDFYANKNVVNGGIVQPLIMGVAPDKKEEKKEQKGKKKKEEQAGEKVEQLQQIFNEQQWNLLYNSFELFCDNAKRNQIIMMRHLIFRIKETYNKEFQKILKFRQNQNQIINDKNKRIEEICEELKRPNQVIKGKRNILESNQSVLQVHPNEIPFKKYLSKEEREKAEKERLKQQARLKKLAQDDASQRALQKMMGGTLQEKKTSVLEVTVDRQKWMDKPLQEMNEDQKVKMKQYEQKRQKAEQEKERIVKKLQAELRKLKQQIDDIMEKYDQKLFALIKRKLEYDYRIEEQELYCTRLYLSSAIVKQQEKKQKQLLQQIELSKIKLTKLADDKQALNIQQEELQHAKETKHAALDAKKLGDIESKIKTIEKSIFEEYNSNFKKRREMEEKLVEADPSYKNLLVPLDPMKEIQSKNVAAQKAKDFYFFLAEIKVLQQTYDIPQNSLLQILQFRFNIRREEAQLQTRVKMLKDTLVLLQQKQEESQQRLNKQEQELTAINIYLERAESDLQIECRIKQGQVELNNDKPVPELQQALLISRSQIEEKNSKIMVNANEKIKVMEQIKVCKISVTEQTLNLQKKEDLINRLNTMIKQIQMLKVKKEMQVALAKKDTKINENEIKSLKEQIEKVRKEGEKRIALFQKKIEKIGVQIETIRKENKQLQTQKWNLEATVKQREKIKEMMVGERGEGDQEAQQKFEQIAINRKLFDRAKQQTEQIELLREELSKLKAKTFANFSNAQR